MSSKRSAQLATRCLSAFFLGLLFCGLIGCTPAERQEINATPAPAATHTPIALIAQADTPLVPEATATSRPPSRTPSPPGDGGPSSPFLSEPTVTPTATPPTPSPTTTPIPTSSVVPGWLTYVNKFLGYSFSYPPEARIRVQGVTGFPTDELPENVTAEEYQAELEAKYPDDLCVTVTYKTTFITFVPSDDSVGKYTVPCGVTGVGDYDVESNIESLIIGNVQMVGDVFWLSGRDSGAWHGEFTMLNPHDNVGIHFGSLSGTQEKFLQARETMMQIVFSFRQE